MRMPGHDEERRADAALPLATDNPLEAPVRVGAPDPVHRRDCERARLGDRGSEPAPADRLLDPRDSAAQTDPAPPPGHVDVVREGDGEAGAAPSRRLDAEPCPQALERRVERIERGPVGQEPAVLIEPRRLPRPLRLLDPRKVEERVGELVAGRALAGADTLPRLGRIRKLLSEADV